MKAKVVTNGITAHCAGCDGAVSNFTVVSEFSRQLRPEIRDGNFLYTREVFRHLKCPHCEMGAIAQIQLDPSPQRVVNFYPLAVDSLNIPSDVPDGIRMEFREAETDAAIGNYRSGSAMLRSTLEKTLKANGYTRELMKSLKRRDNLEDRIELAFEDNIITEVRKNKAQQDIRVLGNDVLHDEWKEIKEDEYEAAHLYTQRILEDFYTDRSTVEEILKKKGRVK